MPWSWRPSGRWLNLRLRFYVAAEAAIEVWVSATDAAMRYGGPVYVACATALILTVAGVFFISVLPEISNERGFGNRLAHGCLAIWLLFNVLFNYYHCVRTPPGTTECLEPCMWDEEACERNGVRYCHRCQRVKPTLAHHCHICDKCVLRMDHHCPFVHNCIGHYNYRYFFLFITYLWVGSLYGAVMTWLRLSAITEQAHGQGLIPQHPTPLVFAFVLATAVGMALAVLLGCHLYFVLTGQGTIDAAQNLSDCWAARQQGERWVNVFNLGPVRNFQERFDVKGPLWWLAWLLPSWTRKQGDGITFATVFDTDSRMQELSYMLA